MSASSIVHGGGWLHLDLHAHALGHAGDEHVHAEDTGAAEGRA